MSFAPGNIVRTREREWVVLPDSTADLLLLKPLGGTDEEITGILPSLENVESASFRPPDHTKPGDSRSGRFLRDAVRLSLRAGAGPFRSFGRLAIEPRPYQLVPLLMALDQNPIRLLVADDVGIGKTVEALLIARELLDRGEISRMAVLCPPHLAEQWQREMRSKFHLEAVLVLGSTARRLESDLAIGESIFDRHPIVIVSLDYIKSAARRDEFLRSCPEFVIVDEAHTCTKGEERGRQLRFELIQDLSQKENQHLVLVTATPHSGKTDAFGSLLSLLKPDFAEFPPDLTGPANRHHRERLARHLVQRRRADIRHFMDADTRFPDRLESEETYTLNDEYRKLFADVLAYSRELVAEREGESKIRQRVRWWSALALLRSLSSSPAAAAVTLRNRAASCSAGDVTEANLLGQKSVMDLTDSDGPEGEDVPPGADWTEEGAPDSEKRRLRDFAKRAETLEGDKDPKLQAFLKPLKKLLSDGYNPIVFCRFIDTAEYLAKALRESLPKKYEIAAVTGLLAPAEREGRIDQLTETATANGTTPILVCTDCLSEGVNLQQTFNAVVHYDLAWNPTRHEQREGRVDRFGQPKDDVRVLTYYSKDNQVDGLVLEILLQKHKRIRSALGISIPLPVDSEQVMAAIMEGLILRGGDLGRSSNQGLFDFVKPIEEDVEKQWQSVSDREKRSRSLFAQESLKPEQVLPEWQAVRDAVGTSAQVKPFVLDAFAAFGATCVEKQRFHTITLNECPRELRDSLSLGDKTTLNVVFENPVPDGAILLTRSHPLTDALASYVLDSASDPFAPHAVARRCGVTITKAVERRTTLLLLRFRHHLLMVRGKETSRLLAEECVTLAFRGPARQPEWLASAEVETLLGATPAGSITPDLASHDLERSLTALPDLNPHLEIVASNRAAAALEAHRRVRDASKIKGLRYDVEAVLPVDVLGLYLLQPAQPNL